MGEKMKCKQKKRKKKTTNQTKINEEKGGQKGIRKWNMEERGRKIRSVRNESKNEM